MSSSQFNPEIAIIGGGPAGLYAAARLADVGVDPSSIVIYEPREHYTRPGAFLAANFVELDKKFNGKLSEYLEDCKDKDKEKYNKMIKLGGIKAKGHIKDYERILHHVVLHKKIKIEPYRFTSFNQDQDIVELFDEKNQSIKINPSYAIEASGHTRAVVNSINTDSKEKPFSTELFSDNPIPTHFIAYVKIDPEYADLLQFKDSNKIPASWLEEIQSKFKWPYPVAPKLQFHSFGKNKYCIYLETPGNLTPDQYESWLSAVLKLYTEKAQDIPFSQIKPPQKYPKKPRFLPIPVKPLKVSPSLYKSKNSKIILAGDSLLASHYELGTGIEAAETAIDTFIECSTIKDGKIVSFDSEKYQKTLKIRMLDFELEIQNLLKTRKKELGIPTVHEKSIFLSSDIKRIKLLSDNSKVGEIWLCEQGNKTIVLKKFLLGKPGQSSINQINSLRNIILSQFPIYNVLNQCPFFVKIHGIVVPDPDDVDFDGSEFTGMAMEFLENYETFSQLEKRYTEKKQFLEPKIIIDLLINYLEALAFLNAAGLSSHTQHSDNIMVDKNFHLKIVDVEMIGATAQKTPEKDIEDIYDTFSPLLTICDQKNENIKKLFKQIQSGEFKTIESCFTEIKQTFSLPKELKLREFQVKTTQVKPSTARAQELYQNYIELLDTEHQQIEQKRIDYVEYQIDNLAEKNPEIKSNYTLLKEDGFEKCKDILIFLKKISKKSLSTATKKDIKGSLTGNWPNRFEGFQNNLRKTELLNLIDKAEESTVDADKKTAITAIHTAVKECKKLTDENILSAFKNLLWVVLQRRKDGFFHPLNTTTSGEAIRTELNTADYPFLSALFNKQNKEPISYRDLRKFLIGNDDTNTLFHEICKPDHYNEAKDVLKDESKQIIIRRTNVIDEKANSSCWRRRQ